MLLVECSVKMEREMDYYIKGACGVTLQSLEAGMAYREAKRKKRKKYQLTFLTPLTLVEVKKHRGKATI